jgi:hypothetical protein
MGLSPTPFSSISTWLAGKSDGIVRRADDLGRRAHRVGILHLDFHFAGYQVTAGDTLSDRVWRCGLPLKIPAACANVSS